MLAISHSRSVCVAYLVRDEQPCHSVRTDKLHQGPKREPGVWGEDLDSDGVPDGRPFGGEGRRRRRVNRCKGDTLAARVKRPLVIEQEAQRLVNAPGVASLGGRGDGAAVLGRVINGLGQSLAARRHVAGAVLGAAVAKRPPPGARRTTQPLMRRALSGAGPPVHADGSASPTADRDSPVAWRASSACGAFVVRFSILHGVYSTSIV